MNPKRANNIFLLCLFGGALVGGIGSTMEMKWLAGVSIVIMMGGLVLRMVFYRCPHCGSYLDRSTGEFCPHCGKKLGEK